MGKIGIPDEVLNKPGRLTEEEFEEIKDHSLKGYAILKTIEENPKLAMVGRFHHEKYDGSGYPEGIAGEDIPEEARIIAVADAYDAMSSDRSYRSHLPQDMIKYELDKGKGGQFDPKFADIMLSIIDEDTGYNLRYTMHD